jgi:hypothetical protein
LFALFSAFYLLRVVPLGIEPRLFCTKNRRVASYTMGQFDANLLSIFYPTKYFF